jgi:2-oxoacid:acceptor oxidoreductase delta subunit (pyruvate/2-ketoisovalerate family)
MSDSEQKRNIPPVSVSNTTTLVNKTGSWKYIRPVYQDRVAPCNAGCPVGIDIEGYLNLLREERIDEAMELLLRENPIPAVTGRVCDHPCEVVCNRRYFDEPVAIHSVERMLGDRILEAHLPEPIPRTHDERVAVIGSGPAGLACAYHLTRQGYAVTVFEAASEAGGMLRLGIPEYRLPRNVLDRQIARIEALGVEIKCATVVGRDIFWDDLADFAAVFVATGAHDGRKMGMEGEDVEGVRSGLDFLKEVNGGGRPEVGKKVVVVGGGNTAMDCARTALRLGAEPTVLYRRTRNEMPAIEQEIEEAEHEGIDFIFLAAPLASRSENGKLAGIECQRMELGPPDDSGRRRPVPTDETFFLEADTVLAAIGEVPDIGFLPEDVSDNKNSIHVTLVGGTGRATVFAGGDVTDDERTVAYALGSGKRAAIGIDRYFRSRTGGGDGVDPESLSFGPEGNLSMTRWRDDDPIHRESPVNAVVTYDELNPSHFVHLPSHPDHHMEVEEAKKGFGEANQGLPVDEAVAEALRCLNCGVCNQCELCMIFCPDRAIHKKPDGTGFYVDMDYCKGCGICAEECPRGAIAMVREDA